LGRTRHGGRRSGGAPVDRARGYPRLDVLHSGRSANHLSPMMTKFISTLLIASCLALNTAGQESDELRLARIISDNMVLQQQKPITLWG
jgi:hypothetical protein